eukprot:783933-Pelagomonas_calceolata.AAC.6
MAAACTQERMCKKGTKQGGSAADSRAADWGCCQLLLWKLSYPALGPICVLSACIVETFLSSPWTNTCAG